MPPTPIRRTAAERRTPTADAAAFTLIAPSSDTASYPRLQELLLKYDRPGPRYTSYPPAPHFTDRFGSLEYESRLEQLHAEVGERNDISLYVHLPFCDSLCYFCGCSMIVSSNRARIAEYLHHLRKEIDLLSSEISPTVRVTQMHWGGGSPTHLLPQEIEHLGKHIRESFEFADDAEVSIEIDPRAMSLEHILAIERAGFNRASIGIQDFDHNVQKAINREQTFDETRTVVEWLRSHSVEKINFDLIYGLPHQNASRFEATISRALLLKPNRLAVYNFAYVPWAKPHQKLIQIETLPPTDRKLQLQLLAMRKFQESGYEYIGMDHYALQDDELAIAARDGSLTRNFQGYSTKDGTDLYGLGMSAISHVETVYAQNLKDLNLYYAAIDRGEFPVERGYDMTFDDQVRSFVIQRLMCHGELSKREIERTFAIPFERYFHREVNALDELSSDGLIESDNMKIRITPTGKLFLRNIAMAFDAYQQVDSTTKYSRTV